MKKAFKMRFDLYPNYISSFLIEIISLNNELKCLQKCCQNNKCAFLISNQQNKSCFLFTDLFRVNSFDKLNEINSDSLTTFYFTK